MTKTTKHHIRLSDAKAKRLKSLLQSSYSYVDPTLRSTVTELIAFITDAQDGGMTDCMIEIVPPD